METLIKLTIEHVGISLGAIAISIAIGVPLGYFASNSKKINTIVSNSFQTLRLIPSIAILLLLLPILGTGYKPTMIALVILGIPPILLNTITAFSTIQPVLLENAKAFGLTERQTLMKVKVPLATPIILAGIKIAVIEIIASATLAAKIGAGGLGELIFSGLGLNDFNLLFVGGISVAILSIVAIMFVDGIERIVCRYKYKK